LTTLSDGGRAGRTGGRHAGGPPRDEGAADEDEGPPGRALVGEGSGGGSGRRGRWGDRPRVL